MKINWKLRFKNKTTLASIASLVIMIVYRVINQLGIVPIFSQSFVMELCMNILTLLGLLGVIVDPTTTGISDSKRAMQYDWPWDDEADTDCVAPRPGGNG